MEVKSIESNFYDEQKQILINNIQILSNGTFQKLCPTAYSNVFRNLEYLVGLHDIAIDNIKNESFIDKSGSIVFFASASYICRKFNISLNSMNKVYKKNVQMVYHRLINKLDENENPKSMLKHSKAISINSENQNGKCVNVYSIPIYSNDLMQEIEAQGTKWKNNKYTMRGLSREMFYRAEGLQVANKLYPQYKKITIDGEVQDRTTTAISDERTNNIVKAIFKIIETKKYATEKDVVYYLANKYRYEITEEQMKRSLKEILDLYGLERVRANKEIKDKYEVNSSGYPFVIVKNDGADIA